MIILMIILDLKSSILSKNFNHKLIMQLKGEITYQGDHFQKQFHY